MRRLIPLCALTLLLVSCQHPQPTAGWGGSRQPLRNRLLKWCPEVPAELGLLVYPDINDTLVPAFWPRKVDGAVTLLLEAMDDAFKKTVKDSKKEDLTRFDMTLGRGIRNAFGLWAGNEALMKDCHEQNPESASMVIMQALWQRLQES